MHITDSIDTSHHNAMLPNSDMEPHSGKGDEVISRAVCLKGSVELSKQTAVDENQGSAV